MGGVGGTSGTESGGSLYGVSGSGGSLRGTSGFGNFFTFFLALGPGKPRIFTQESLHSQVVEQIRVQRAAENHAMV